MIKSVLHFEEAYPGIKAKVVYHCEYDGTDGNTLGLHLAEMLRMLYTSRSDPDGAAKAVLELAIQYCDPNSHADLLAAKIAE